MRIRPGSNTFQTSLVGLALALVVPGAHAQDAVCATETALSGTGGSGAGFGNGLDIDGDIAVVAGNFEAYAFHWDGASWVQEDILTIPGAENGFAISVAVDGDTALLGAPNQDGAGMDSGRVVAFVRDGAGNWTLEDELFASDAAAGDLFGFAVALEGDRALIGAYRDEPAGNDSGSAYIFERTGSVWAEVKKIVAADGTDNDTFGQAVALSGDTAVIGANGARAAYVYIEDGGAWSEQDKIEVPALLDFGVGVAIDGDRAIVGARSESRVFERSGTVWSETAVLDAPGPNVELQGDLAVLSGNSCFFLDPAIIFLNEGGTWMQKAELFVPNGEGNPLGISGLRVLVGSRNAVLCDGGNASVFDLAIEPPPSVAFRNAGTNPVSYTADSAAIGGSLEFEIDLTTTGHSQALVVGFDSPFTLTLGGGQTLLCFDLLGSGGELINTGFGLGPIVNLSVAVPNDPTLIGFSVCTQAIHAFGIAPFALSNAQDLVIGGCP